MGAGDGENGLIVMKEVVRYVMQNFSCKDIWQNANRQKCITCRPILESIEINTHNVPFQISTAKVLLK